MKKLLILTLLSITSLTFFGCALFKDSPATTVYKTEKLIADSTASAVHVFNVYYAQQMGGNQPPSNVDELNKTRDQIHAASKKVGQTLALVDSLRLNYTANPAQTNQSAMFIALQSASDQSSNIVAVVKMFMGTNTIH